MKHQPECFSAGVEGRRSEAPIYGLLCICDRLKMCEKRGYSAGYSAAMEDGWGQPKNRKAVMNAALDAARAAIEAIPDGYKIRGEFESYSAYHEGRSDFKDGALAAIDELRQKM